MSQHSVFFRKQRARWSSPGKRITENTSTLFIQWHCLILYYTRLMIQCSLTFYKNMKHQPKTVIRCDTRPRKHCRVIIGQLDVSVCVTGRQWKAAFSSSPPDSPSEPVVNERPEAWVTQPVYQQQQRPNSSPYLARVIIYGLSGSFWTTQCILISLVSSENSCHYSHFETVVPMKGGNAPLEWLYSY